MQSKLILLIFLFSPSVYADTNWIRVAANTTLVIDMLQTADIAKDPDIVETNPILGAHPEANDVYKYFITTILITNFLGEMLPEPYGDYLYLSVAVVQTKVIRNNYLIGVKLEF